MKKLSLVLALLSASCATGTAIENGVKAGGKIALHCAEDNISSQASQILPAIIAILSSSSGNWKQQADMYAKNFTQEVALCAARTAVDKLTAPVQSEAVAQDPEAVKRTATARLRELELEANVAN